MKLKTPEALKLHKADETIGFLGSTRLIRHPNGCHELKGGSVHHRTFARQWCEKFAPEISFGPAHQKSTGPLHPLEIELYATLPHPGI